MPDERLWRAAVAGEGNPIGGRILYADTFLTRLIGLMFRRAWPPGLDGILFPHCASVHTCFTFLKPDILFIGEGGVILGIVPEAPPWRVFRGPRGTRKVLELPSSPNRKRQNMSSHGDAEQRRRLFD